jgi:signal transduction histidine kinase
MEASPLDIETIGSVAGRDIERALSLCGTGRANRSPALVPFPGPETSRGPVAVASAEQRADLVASRARLVAAGDEARRRIERDLHDGPQQGLVTLALKVRALRATLGPDSEALAEELADVGAGLDEVLDELRELSRGLHPSALWHGGLGPALNTLARRAPLHVDVAVLVPDRLSEAIEVAVYFLVAEALTNVAKHGHASGVTVGVEARDGAVTASVSDDGIGGADPRRGSGLIGLRDRVEELGGTIAVTSARGAGTSVVAHIPIPRSTL